MQRKLLVVAAHPDDEILGCGATVARLIHEGWQAQTLILGEGVTSRDAKRSRETHADEIKKLRQAMREANAALGMRDVIALDFPDNRFDTVPLLDIVKEIEKVKSQFQPELIFTHHADDLNIDHQICQKAVLTATRPLKEESVKQVLSFEILSSTEWNYPNRFAPNIFYNVSGTLQVKQSAIACYKEELRDFPHPRSLDGIALNAKYWGMRVGVPAAEAFICLRSIL